MKVLCVLSGAVYCKEFCDRDLIQGANADNLQDFIQALVNLKLLFGDCHEEVSTEGCPNLAVDSISGAAEEISDTQVLFDPFKKQFYLPSSFVEFTNRQRRQVEIIAQENQGAVFLPIPKAQSTQGCCVSVFGIFTDQANGLITTQTCCLIDLGRSNDAEPDVSFVATNFAPAVCSFIKRPKST